MRLIDADALKAGIENEMCRPCEARGADHHGIKCRACGIGDALEFVEDAPTLPNPCGNPCNFTRPTGEWNRDINGWHVCSNCHMIYKGMPTIDRKPRWQYCPTCGAKMKEAEE